MYDRATSDTPQCIEQSAFGAASQTLTEAREVAYRVLSIVDRIVGVVPTAESGKGEKSAPVDGVFPLLKTDAKNTLDVLHLAHDALGRLERALP